MPTTETNDYKTSQQGLSCDPMLGTFRQSSLNTPNTLSGWDLPEKETGLREGLLLV